MSSPGKRNITLYQGDSYEMQISFSTADTGPVDITGHTFAAQIRTSTADADNGAAPLATFTCTADDPTAGILFLTLDPSDTTALKSKVAAWDLQGTAPDGAITTYLAGAVSVQLEVTRP